MVVFIAKFPSYVNVNVYDSTCPAGKPDRVVSSV